MSGVNSFDNSPFSGLRREKSDLVCLYGAGDAGRLIYELLGICNIKIDYFLDNNPDKWGSYVVDGVKCIPPKDVVHKNKCIVIVCINWRGYLNLCSKAKQDGFNRFFELAEVIDELLLNHRELICGFVKCLSNYESDVDVIFPSCINSTPRVLGKADQIIVKKKIAVYTASFGDYDELYLPKYNSDNIDYYFVSDQKPAKLGVYHWIDGKKVIPENISSPIMRNRFAKMHPKSILSDYDYTIYVDSNLEIIDDLSVFIRNSRTGISVHTHYNRDCLYYEAMQVVNYKRIVWEDAYDQIMRYLNDGFPLHFGLGEMPVIAIDHTKPSADVIMNAWWEEFNRGALRDQLSFMYVVWKLGCTADDIASIGTEYRESDRFIHHLHKAQSEMVSRIL